MLYKNPQQIESQQQVVRQAASLTTTSWTTYRTASPQQIHKNFYNNQQVLQQVAQLVVQQIHS